MKRNRLNQLAVLTAVLFASAGGAFAGTFKHISIDGDFSDWAGVPVAYSQAQDTTEVVAYKDISVANDENYLYIRFSIYGSDNPFTYLENMFLDADTNGGTGFNAGGYVGSEMLIQSGTGYQEKNGAFNEGGINGLGWLASPDGVGSQFEIRISRNATYASDSTPVFSGNSVGIELESDNSSFVNIEWFPPAAGGVVYTFETPPAVLTSNLTLVGLSNKSWQVNDSGTDLGTTWLSQAYDDSLAPWSAGLGLFGFTTQPGSYPTIQKALTSGRNTYYFRTHFNWNFDTANLAFVGTNYLSDGAVYYLNGSEVRRLRMPSGTVSYSTSASRTNSPVGHADILGFPGNSLFIGDNILEVETHQAPSSSSDMVFGLSLTASTSFPATIVDTNLPVDQTVIGGQPVTFTADVLGSGPLRYQWLKNGASITDATNPIYTIPLVLTNDVANYSLRVANSLATNTTRQAHLTVNSTPVVINDTAQPADQVVVEGRPVTFNVVASGSALLQYQWLKGATPIAGETNATYAIGFTDPTNAGSYHAMVSNPAGSTNSRTANLTVLLDTIPPTVVSVAAASTQIVLQFAEPLDPVSANIASHYVLSGGINISSAMINPSDATQVTLTTSSSLAIGTLYSLTITGVKDLFGNASGETVPFARNITIDGNFGDWQGVTPIYSGPSGMDGAADFQDIYMANDASHYYFRVTLYHDIPPASGEFPAYVNMFFNTDNDPNTGYSAIGSDLLIQSGFAYQEKNGGFNEGAINGLNWVSAPSAPSTDFEFSFSKLATFVSDGTAVFPTNVLTFLFQGMTPGFVVLNQAPYDGSLITYTDTLSVSVPPVPPGRLAIGKVAGSNGAVTWNPPGTLQYRDSLTSGTWTNLPSASSPYLVPPSGSQRYFRLAQ